MSRYVLVEFASDGDAERFITEDPAVIAWGADGWNVAHMLEYEGAVQIGDITEHFMMGESASE